MNEKKLAKIFADNQNQFELFDTVREFIKQEIEEAEARENVCFYETVCKLQNSINNAGWESRHSEQIDILNKESNRITDSYEEYLP